ncbi:MAG TPA: hypothetical protein VFD37_06870, partial [Solirubrobacterales bacterium]|nr:hypothetical protein [Solirubrobacterales bacterium]
MLLRGRERPFALIGQWAGGGALLGSDPVAVADADEDPFAVLERQPAPDPALHAPTPDASASHAPPSGAAAPVDPSLAIIGGGWFGYLGYRLGGRVESLDPTPPPACSTLPEFALAFYDHLVRLDRDGRWWFEALLTSDREPRIRARLAELIQLDLAALPDTSSAPAAPTALRPLPFSTTEWQATPSPAGHARAVAACRERIRAGDLFQA